MREKSLKDISWDVPESVYREDPALSYSALATYERGGFNCLESLYDKKDTPSLTFGSAVDALITGGQEEFDERFFVADFPEIPDTIIKIVKDCFREFHVTNRTLSSVSDIEIVGRAASYNYQNNWKPETRAKVIKEKGEEYYNLLFLAEDKVVLSSDTYNEVLTAVRALRESPATQSYFAPDNPFDDSIEHLYQLKFKATLNNIDYRCMSDLLLVNHPEKTIYPIDLKTSSHTEWDFYKSFVQWDYQIQARLYWRIIRDNLNRDPYFKDFKLTDYRFIVVNKSTLTPLVWLFPKTTAVGTIVVGNTTPLKLRDPEEIGKELAYYLSHRPSVPIGIEREGDNNIMKWLELQYD